MNEEKSRIVKLLEELVTHDSDIYIYDGASYRHAEHVKLNDKGMIVIAQQEIPDGI